MIAEAVGVLRAKYRILDKARRRREQAAAEPAEAQTQSAGFEPADAPLPEDLPSPGAAGQCQGPRCAAAAADRGAEPGLVARNGVCWRCYNQGRREAVTEALEKAVWPGGARRPPPAEQLVAAPSHPREVLLGQVRTAGVTGANVQHVQHAMRRVGLTARGPEGRVVAPVPSAVWHKRCRCAPAEPHPGAAWFCAACGAAWGHVEEHGEGSRCSACGEGGEGLEWCVACQAFWHEEPKEACPGRHEALRGRGGLCADHGARLAALWWARRAGGPGEPAAAVAAEPAQGEALGGAAVPYPGADPAVEAEQPPPTALGTPRRGAGARRHWKPGGLVRMRPPTGRSRAPARGGAQQEPEEPAEPAAGGPGAGAIQPGAQLKRTASARGRPSSQSRPKMTAATGKRKAGWWPAAGPPPRAPARTRQGTGEEGAEPGASSGLQPGATPQAAPRAAAVQVPPPPGSLAKAGGRPGKSSGLPPGATTKAAASAAAAPAPLPPGSLPKAGGQQQPGMPPTRPGDAPGTVGARLPGERGARPGMPPGSEPKRAPSKRRRREARGADAEMEEEEAGEGEVPAEEEEPPGPPPSEAAEGVAAAEHTEVAPGTATASTPSTTRRPGGGKRRKIG